MEPISAGPQIELLNQASEYDKNIGDQEEKSHRPVTINRRRWGEFVYTVHFGRMHNRIFSLDIDLLSFDEALDAVIDRATRHQSSYVCFANVHMTIEACRDSHFQRQVNDSTYTFADGTPILLALRSLYGCKQERVAGMDFMPSLLDRASRTPLNVFLFGSTEEMLAAVRTAMEKKHPDVNLVGSISPPFRPMSQEENHTFLQQMNDADAHIVLVALGCPKQEAWMAEKTER